MRVFLFISFLCLSVGLFSKEETTGAYTDVSNFKTGINLSELKSDKPNPVWFKFFKKQSDRKKVIAGVLAFPIPGGILGLHRIYLGTKPYVPLIYILTLGGGLFILPIVDFCVLMCNKDISRFEDHPGIFMWIDNEKKTAPKTETK